MEEKEEEEKKNKKRKNPGQTIDWEVNVFSNAA
jgi:hypothetical protein